MHPVVELVDNKMILGLGIPAATEKDTAAPPASEGLVVIRLVTMTGQTKSFHCAENGSLVIIVAWFGMESQTSGSPCRMERYRNSRSDRRSD